MRAASGDHAGSVAASGQPRDLPFGAALDVADPDVHHAAPIGGVREGLAIGRPRGRGLERRIRGQPARRAVHRHQPEIAERGKRDLTAVRRHGRMHDALDRLRPREIEAMAFGRERRARERQVGAEFDCSRRAARGRSSFDLPVRRVQHVAARQPLRPERKHVLVGIGDVSIADHQAAVAPGDRVERDGAVRSERRRRERAVGGGDERLGRARGRRRRRVDTGLLAPIRHVRDLGGAAPRRHELVGRRGRDLPDGAGRERQHPDVVAAAAVGRKRQAIAVGRPRRLAIVIRTRRHRLQLLAVGVDGPDLPGAVAIGLKRDPSAVGRPRRLPRVEEDVGDRRRRAALRGHRPQRAEQVDRDRAAVRRQRRRHVRALMERQMHGPRRRLLSASDHGTTDHEDHRLKELVHGG